MMTSNRSVGSVRTMENIRENNENLQVPASHWGSLLALRSGGKMDPEESTSAATPLSPKNQLSPTPRKHSGTKRSAFSFQQPDDEDLFEKCSKRAKLSDQDALLLAMMKGKAAAPAPVSMPATLGGMMPNPLLAGLPQQMPMPSVSPLLLNPALLAATSGYASQAAATQQLLLSQALASTSGVNPLVQQQINSLISAEFARLATDKEVSSRLTMSTALPKAPSPPPTISADPSMDENVACLGLGKEFLPATTQNTRLCDCGMALCHEIGYPHKGSIRFSAKTVDQWCQVLDITDPKRLAQIRSCPEVFSLAYWHFREEDRVLDKLTGKIRLAPHSCMVQPNAHLQSFVDNYKDDNTASVGIDKQESRQPSERMMELHRSWAQFRRAPTLEP